MDGQRFDGLTRALARRASRRTVMRGVAAGAAAGVLARGVPAAAQLTCDTGEIACSGVCVATCCDNNNCGACGVVCTGGLTCFEGQCDCPSGDCGCAEGQLDCGGVCVDSCCDNANCGACGVVCSDGLTCFEGICDCPSGDCDTPDPDPTPAPPIVLPSTGSGGTPNAGLDWTPAAVAAGALALGAAAFRRVRPGGEIRHP